MAEFSVILQTLLSSNNEERDQAESQFNALTLPEKLALLVHAIGNDQSVEVRTIAAVLLRRLCGSSEELLQLDPSLLEPCKENLLFAVQREPNPTVRRKICEAVAEMARACIDDDNVNHWEMVLKFLFECCNPEAPQMYEVALNIIRSVPGVFASQQTHYLAVIKQMLLQALHHPQKEVWVAAVKASTAFIVYQEEEKTKQFFSDLLPQILELVQKTVQEAENDDILQCLVELCSESPKFIRPQFDAVIEFCLKVAGLNELEDSWRHLGIEVVISVAENAAPMFRKYGKKFIPRIIVQALTLMIDIDEDSEWSYVDKIEDEDESSNPVIGEDALDRLAVALGGRAMLQCILTTLPQMLQGDWKHRHAALMALGAVAEGCNKQMQPMLDQMVALIIPFCQDPHVRVRFAACNALGQLSADFAPEFQRKYHSKVFPALLLVMGVFECPRLQAHACAALVNFVEMCPKDILSKYLDEIVAKLDGIFQVVLKELLEKGKKLVLEQIVTTTATVADVAEELFVKYYDRFMPSFKYIVANATGKEYRLLRGKTIECISLTGLAVGTEKFMQDAAEVMSLLLKLQTEQGGDMEPDDPQISYMTSAWGRMCKILGQRFVQYLPVVMEPLLKVASIQPEITFIDSSDAEEAYTRDGGWEFITLADHQRMGIRTSGLEDKYTACQMLVVYARDLGEGFADYVEAVAKIMIPMLRFVFYEMVRVAAAEILPYLLQDISVKGLPAVQQLWGSMADKLLDAMTLEVDSDVWAVMADSLCRCVEYLGANCFNVEQYKKMVTIIKVRLGTSFTRAQDRFEKRQDEDYDEEVEEDLQEEDKEDEQYLSKIADIMHSLFKTHGAQLLPFFDELLPIFTAMVDTQSAAERQWGLCIFDDLIEFASDHALRYQGYFLQPMLKNICSKSASVRQASVYGVGVMAQYAAEHFTPACLDAIPLLTIVVEDPDAKMDFASVHATENAISAMAKICKYVKSGIPYETVLPVWLSWLPVTEDKEEAQHIYGYLCDLIQSQNPFILGPDNVNVPKLLAIFAEALKEEALSGSQEVHQRVIAILRHIQSSQQVWLACLRFLSDEHQLVLSKALASNAIMD